MNTWRKELGDLLDARVVRKLSAEEKARFVVIVNTNYKEAGLMVAAHAEETAAMAIALSEMAGVREALRDQAVRPVLPMWQWLLPDWSKPVHADVERQRAYARMVARPVRDYLPRIAAVLVVALVISLVAGIMRRAALSAGRVTSVEGRAWIVPMEPDGKPRPLAAGAVLTADATIEVGQGSRLTFREKKGEAVFKLDERTRLQLAPEGGGYGLEQGRVEVDSPKRKPDEILKIRTPHGLATVVGTRFSLGAETNVTKLTVTRGVVRFRSPDGREGLSLAGEMTLARDRGAEIWPLRYLDTHARWRFGRELLALDFENEPVPGKFGSGLAAPFAVPLPPESKFSLSFWLPRRNLESFSELRLLEWWAGLALSLVNNGKTDELWLRTHTPGALETAIIPVPERASGDWIHVEATVDLERGSAILSIDGWPTQQGWPTKTAAGTETGRELRILAEGIDQLRIFAP